MYIYIHVCVHTSSGLATLLLMHRRSAPATVVFKYEDYVGMRPYMYRHGCVCRDCAYELTTARQAVLKHLFLWWSSQKLGARQGSVSALSYGNLDGSFQKSGATDMDPK